MKKITYVICLVVTGAYAQQKTVNQGSLSVQPGTLFSTHYDFENKTSGEVLNDGEMHFFGNYQNEGLFSYSSTNTSGYVVFTGSMSNDQKIAGNSPSSFYNVIFNKGNEKFQLTNDITTAGEVDFTKGVVVVDKSQGGSFVFLKGSKHLNTSDISHANGEVGKIGNEDFVYPIGKSDFYRFAAISAPSELSNEFTGEYFLENSNAQYPHFSRTGVIDVIDNQEYWIIENKSNNSSPVLVTLSWDDRTTPSELLTDGGENLHVVRWDAKQNLWVDEGGVIDFADKTVTTSAKIDELGIFTLGKIKPKLINPGDVVIYDGVTPNDDGLNDYFIIDNLENFPNNSVRIFNRWGREVFYTEKYNTSGNVFKGIAEGKGIINKGEKLPAGTYYYVLEYLYEKDNVKQWVKKVGYLHLETNE